MNKQQEEKWKQFLKSMIPRRPKDYLIIIGNALIVMAIFGAVAHFQYNAQYCKETEITYEQTIYIPQLKGPEPEEEYKPYHYYYEKYKETGKLPIGIGLNCTWEINRWLQEDRWISWTGIHKIE